MMWFYDLFDGGTIAHAHMIPFLTMVEYLKDGNLKSHL